MSWRLGCPANGEQFTDTVKGNVVALRSSNISTKIWWRLKTAWHDLRISCVYSPYPCIVNFNGRSALKLTGSDEKLVSRYYRSTISFKRVQEITTRNAKRQRPPAMMNAGDIPGKPLIDRDR
jgi:hypothetical protein